MSYTSNLGPSDSRMLATSTASTTLSKKEQIPLSQKMLPFRFHLSVVWINISEAHLQSRNKNGCTYHRLLIVLNEIFKNHSTYIYWCFLWCRHLLDPRNTTSSKLGIPSLLQLTALWEWLCTSIWRKVKLMFSQISQLIQECLIEVPCQWRNTDGQMSKLVLPL